MPDELFTAQKPAPTPTGKMPGAAEFNEEEATPEEQAQYDQFVNMAMKFMADGAEKMVASMNDKSKPVHENVGEMAVKIGEMVLGSAKSSGVEPGAEVIHAAGAELVEHLMELGDAAGIWPFEQSSDEYDEVQSMAFLHAAKVAGESMLQSPQYNEQVKEEAGNVMAREVAGEVQRGEAPGLGQEGI